MNPGGRLGSWPRSVGARLVALIVVAAIPVLFMAAIIAWQNYRLAADRALQNAVLIREGQVARQQALIDGTAQMLGAVSQLPAVFSEDAATCGHFLADVVGLDPGRYVNLGIVGPDGTLRCIARPDPADMLAAARAACVHDRRPGLVPGGPGPAAPGVAPEGRGGPGTARRCCSAPTR